MNQGAHCVATAAAVKEYEVSEWVREGECFWKRNDGWIKLIENIVSNDMARAHLFSAFKTNSLSLPRRLWARHVYTAIVEAWKIGLERINNEFFPQLMKQPRKIVWLIEYWMAWMLLFSRGWLKIWLFACLMNYL